MGVSFARQNCKMFMKLKRFQQRSCESHAIKDGIFLNRNFTFFLPDKRAYAKTTRLRTSILCIRLRSRIRPQKKKAAAHRFNTNERAETYEKASTPNCTRIYVHAYYMYVYEKHVRSLHVHSLYKLTLFALA